MRQKPYKARISEIVFQNLEKISKKINKAVDFQRMTRKISISKGNSIRLSSVLKIVT